MALVLDGNGTMTVGNGDITGLATGALEAAAIGSGAVLQFGRGVLANDINTSSGSWVTVASVSFTPKVSSSYLLITASASWYKYNNVVGQNGSSQYRIAINGTAIADNYALYMESTMNYMIIPLSRTVRYTPGSTSTITISFDGKTNYATSGLYIYQGAEIQVLEIAA